MAKRIRKPLTEEQRKAACGRSKRHYETNRENKLAYQKTIMKKIKRN